MAPHPELILRWKEPRSFDVLLRLANEKFVQMNEMLDTREARCRDFSSVM